MRSIIVKYKGPTNSKGSRFIVTAFGVPRLTVGYDHSLKEGEQVHKAAAEQLANNHGWLETNKLIGGALPDGSGYAFILVPKK